MDNNHLTETRFSNLELSDAILQSLKEAGFNQCTPIQDKTLPLALRGVDVAGQAQTGTGKTAAFLLATFQYLINAADDTDDEDDEDDDDDEDYDDYYADDSVELTQTEKPATPSAKN